MNDLRIVKREDSHWLDSLAKDELDSYWHASLQFWHERQRVLLAIESDETVDVDSRIKASIALIASEKVIAEFLVSPTLHAMKQTLDEIRESLHEVSSQNQRRRLRRRR